MVLNVAHGWIGTILELDIVDWLLQSRFKLQHNTNEISLSQKAFRANILTRLSLITHYYCENILILTNTFNHWLLKLLTRFSMYRLTAYFWICTLILQHFISSKNFLLKVFLFKVNDQFVSGLNDAAFFSEYFEGWHWCGHFDNPLFLYLKSNVNFFSSFNRLLTGSSRQFYLRMSCFKTTRVNGDLLFFDFFFFYFLAHNTPLVMHNTQINYGILLVPNGIVPVVSLHEHSRWCSLFMLIRWNL